VTVLAAGPVTGGLLGFLVVLGLVVAAVFLFRSMLKHLRKVPPTFDDAPDDSTVKKDGAPPA
jgi:hypothetical protein